MIVLSDGNLFEVFDREENVAKPVLSLARSRLTQDFDQLRMLLGPLQAWFFQKRRVIRSIDKVFDREFILGRLDEFRNLVDRRLRSKYLKVLENCRANIDVAGDAEAHRRYLRNADTVELVDVYLFQPQSWPDLGTITNSLIIRSKPGGFDLLYRLFPDHPRDANDIFWAQALYVLMTMETRSFAPNWLPAFLGGVPIEPRNLTKAIENLIALCLSCFEIDEGRKVILLFAAAIRRVFKVLGVIDPTLAQAAQARHAIQRFMGDELNFSQFISSPEGHLLQQLDMLARRATDNFVRSNADEQDRIRPEMAKQQLRQLWAHELALLETIPDYRKLLAERDLGEMRMTEANCVTRDALVNYALCFIIQFDRWRDHVLAQHGAITRRFAAMGYMSARRLLGISQAEPVEPIDDRWIAGRFFFEDEEIARPLRKAYQT